MQPENDNYFRGVALDMDGVLTDTARVHEKAWKKTFDEYLTSLASNKKVITKPFSNEDYLFHVDGKPRYEGVKNFLNSRNIELSYGDPKDEPGKNTVCGIGNRKNEAFVQLLEEESVNVFEDSIATIEKWKLSELKLALISASKNCRSIIEKTGMLHYFDVIVDGQFAEDHQLKSKKEIFQEVAKQLQLNPFEVVAIEDAQAGVKGAKEVGYGLVVGINRKLEDDDTAYLEEVGADMEVTTLSKISFKRRMPKASEHLHDMIPSEQEGKLVFFLDFDGTLASIVSHPDDARLTDELESTLKKLSELWPVAIVSGRDKQDVKDKVKLDNLLYAGSHGFDISGNGIHKNLPEAEDAIPAIDAIEEKLKKSLSDIEGLIFERKRYAVGLHYRQVHDEEKACERIEEKINSLIEENKDKVKLRLRRGKKVYEIEPDIPWHKGKAVSWLVESLNLDPSKMTILYIGDDVTDEDAFASLSGHGIGIKVGGVVSHTLAHYYLENPHEVNEFLRQVIVKTSDFTSARDGFAWVG